MTFTIVVYDVNQSKNREVHSFLRMYMSWVQNSVFEGELTKSELRKIKNNLSEMIDIGDSVIIYELGNKKYVNKEVLGDKKGNTGQII